MNIGNRIRRSPRATSDEKFKIIRNNVSSVAAGLHSQRLFELDVMRSFAIILIFFFHVPYVVGFAGYGQSWGPQPPDIFGQLLFWLQMVGVGLFFFVSGYAIDLKNGSMTSSNDVKNFFFKRATRIYLLYWLALVVSFGASQILFTFFNQDGWLVNSSLSVYVINFLGLQVLLAPRFLGLDLVIIWFVGVILLYYLFYPVIVRRSSNHATIITKALVIFLLCGVIHLVFNIIDFRFFLYYLIFIAGLLAQRSNFLHSEISKVYYLSAIFVLCILATIYYILGGVIKDLNLSFWSVYNISISIYLIEINAMVLLFIFIVASLVKSQSRRMGKRVHTYIGVISYASYAIFLFHLFFIELFREFFDLVGLQRFEIALIVIIVGFPLITLFSFYLQKCADMLLAYLITRFSKD
jgi:peptidoglycan/LPS O-acetylase OafA/YrhL